MSDEQPYKKREIDNFHERMFAKLDKIEEQVRITNGRTTKLEQWRWFITGGLSILTIVILPLVFIAVRSLI